MAEGVYLVAMLTTIPIEATIQLKPGRERSVNQRHPWIFSGGLAESPDLPPGTFVRVADSAGKVIGVGSYNPKSNIRVRLYRFDDGPVDADFIKSRLQDAAVRREHLVPPEQQACRWVFGESDGLPGIVIDRYNEVTAVQCNTAGAEALKPLLTQVLLDTGQADIIIERGESSERTKEGLQQTKGFLHGEDPGPFVVDLGNLKMEVDVMKGQKTGMYLDQIANWSKVASWARGRKVLDAFSYTCGFGVAAALAGAKTVTFVDSSKRALEAVERNLSLNDTSTERHLDHGDVQEVLARYHSSTERFGLVILDPPPLAKRAIHVKDAADVMRKQIRAALDVTEPHGIIAAFSCSAAIDDRTLATQIAISAYQCRRDVQLIEPFVQPPDHPVLTTFQEARYLHGWLVHVV